MSRRPGRSTGCTCSSLRGRGRQRVRSLARRAERGTDADRRFRPPARRLRPRPLPLVPALHRAGHGGGARDSGETVFLRSLPGDARRARAGAREGVRRVDRGRRRRGHRSRRAPTLRGCRALPRGHAPGPARHRAGRSARRRVARDFPTFCAASKRPAPSARGPTRSTTRSSLGRRAARRSSSSRSTRISSRACRESPPESFHVVTPNPVDPVQSFRVADFAAFYRFVRKGLKDAVAAGSRGARSRELPGAGRLLRRLPLVESVRQAASQRRSPLSRGRDHAASHARARGAGHHDSRSAGRAGPPASLQAAQGLEGVDRAGRNQARVQLEERNTGKPVNELLQPVEAGRGLAKLPAPFARRRLSRPRRRSLRPRGRARVPLRPHDPRGRTAKTRHVKLWAHSDAEEKVAFEKAVDEILASWAANPGMHVYHYAPYEPSAFKRLMGRHVTRESEIDRMLRAGLFVDLYSVVRQGLRASVEKYSIKDLEKFYGFERQAELADASAARRVIEHALETETPDVITPEVRTLVEDYNQEDCVSALAAAGLARSDSGSSWRTVATPVPRPSAGDGEASEEGPGAQRRGSEGDGRAPRRRPRGEERTNPRAAGPLAARPHARVPPPRGQGHVVGVLPAARPRRRGRPPRRARGRHRTEVRQADASDGPREAPDRPLHVPVAGLRRARRRRALYTNDGKTLGEHQRTSTARRAGSTSRNGWTGSTTIRTRHSCIPHVARSRDRRRPHAPRERRHRATASGASAKSAARDLLLANAPRLKKGAFGRTRRRGQRSTSRSAPSSISIARSFRSRARREPGRPTPARG